MYMIDLKDIKIEDYTYDLPSEKIALYPAEKRENAKLLVYDKRGIQEAVFSQLATYLPKDSALVFNNTRVIHARILLRKSTGAEIEFFCLKPISPTTLYEQAFEVQAMCEWECFIGNNKRFNTSITNTIACDNNEIILTVEKIKNQVDTSFLVRFSWTPTTYTFAEVLAYVGKIPLPPYIKREVNADDIQRYQTVYASEKGSVAAPTAGLHFTTPLLESLQSIQIPMEYITLHVGAGTFKPVTDKYIVNHAMHEEALFFKRETIENIKHLLHKRIIGVGTTTIRSLESLYWIGVKMGKAQKQHKAIDTDCFIIHQWEVYQDLQAYTIPAEKALQHIIDYLYQQKMSYFHASTCLIILPKVYTLQICKGIITNFHQPQSTLLLLISAFVGDKWNEIYEYALTHQFRFLSYGDVCLFI
jgi:S-adenosylmethionine:tRNA ribosyltransferase-isomerase